jgi:glutaminyl-peptide cyclotransferase
MRFYLLILFALFAFSCGNSTNINTNNSNINGNKTSGNNMNNNTNNSSNKPSAGLPVYGYEVVNNYKHDQKAFTEGLFFHNGFLYESTGEQGKSSLRKVEPETGKVVQSVDLPNDSFGEGITLFDGKIYQLTWQERTCRVFDAETFKLLKELRYQGDGWGLTNDGKNLIMTDSTHVIRFLDPETFQTVRTISVFRENGKPLMNINELEYIKGEIWANIWHSEDPDILGKPNYIVRINPSDGKILGWIDLDKISPDDVERDTENTLNGIAYDEATDRIFVTGKNWKKLFEIRLKSKQ